jgi:hypothetical protein
LNETIKEIPRAFLVPALPGGGISRFCKRNDTHGIRFIHAQLRYKYGIGGEKFSSVFLLGREAGLTLLFTPP